MKPKKKPKPDEGPQCQVCGECHGIFVCEPVKSLSAELFRAGLRSSRERALRNKCRWEHMTRSAVLSHYGDPSHWNRRHDDAKKPGAKTP